MPRLRLLLPLAAVLLSGCAHKLYSIQYYTPRTLAPVQVSIGDVVWVDEKRDIICNISEQMPQQQRDPVNQVCWGAGKNLIADLPPLITTASVQQQIAAAGIGGSGQPARLTLAVHKLNYFGAAGTATTAPWASLISVEYTATLSDLASGQVLWSRELSDVTEKSHPVVSREADASYYAGTFLKGLVLKLKDDHMLR